MRFSAPLILLLCALVTAVVSFLGDDSFLRLTSMQKGVSQQERTNDKLQEQVNGLKRQVAGLQNDGRAVEKAARNELGMARPDEVIVIFERKEKTVSNGSSSEASAESR
jgi:cell division protein FtsB